MSVLCCQIPDFLIRLELRRTPALDGLPLALLGADERVWAASPAAQGCGVSACMAARQARARCPDLRMRALDAARSQSEQDAFLGEMARWELPVEEQGWGGAYLDLHSVAATPEQVRPLAAELGRRVRSTMGAALQPALGWDSGKFTARAAASCAAPGAIRMVGHAEEAHFLGPLSVTLLPLPEAALLQLHWLGIRTLGQFAALPPTAVWQRFGQAGKLAQRWAQGRDNRPVCGTLRAPAEKLAVEIEPPTDQIGRVLTDAMAALRPLLRRLALSLAGVRRLRLQLAFIGDEANERSEGALRRDQGALRRDQGADAMLRTLEITFVEPASHEGRVQAALAQQLQALIWPGRVERLELTIQESGELAPAQLGLFAGLGEASGEQPAVELAQRLTGRYGRCFFFAQIVEATHPVAERVFRLQPL